MSKKYIVDLSAEERKELELFLRSGKGGHEKQTRAWILLKADRNAPSCHWPDARICEAYGVSPRKVERVRQRLVEEGFEAAFHRKSGYQTRPPKVTGTVESHLVTLCCSAPPDGRSRWTLKLLGDRLGEMEIIESISHEAVRQVLKKTNSNPGARSSGASRPKPTPPSSARWRKS